MIEDKIMAKRKEESILANILHIGVGTIANMLIGFLTTPIITRLVVPEEYGRISIFNLYISIAVMVLCLGLDQTLVRYFYKHNEVEYQRWLMIRCYGIPFLATAVCSIIFLLLVVVVGISFDFSDMPFIFVTGVFAELTYRFASLNLRLIGMGKKYAIASIIYKAFYVAVVLGLMTLLGKYEFRMLAIGTVLGYIVASLYSILNAKSIWKFDFHSKFGDVSISELIRYGLPFILAMGLSTLFSAIDRLTLKELCDLHTVGIYASALNLVHVFAIIQSSFNAVWTPVAVKHYEDNPNDTAFYSRYNSRIAFVMFAFGTVFIMCKDLFGLLLGAQYRECAQLLPFLAMHPIMYSISETTVTGVVVKKKSHLHIYISLIACALNLCGNICLIPYFGGKGAAISTGISYVAFYGLRTFWGNRYYYFEHNERRFWIVTISMIGYAIYNTFADFGIVSILLFAIEITIVHWAYRNTATELYKFMIAKVKVIIGRLRRKIG